jgi:hypothetical protein
VGQGRGAIKGSAGTYSKNGQKFVALPADEVSFRLGANLE